MNIEFKPNCIYDIKYYSNDELYTHVEALYTHVEDTSCKFDIICTIFNWELEIISCEKDYTPYNSKAGRGYKFKVIGTRETNPEYFL